MIFTLAVADFLLRHWRLVLVLLALQLTCSAIQSRLHPAPAPAEVAVLASYPVEAVTPATWAQALLGVLGDPVSSENLRAVTAWERAEGGHWSNRARFNPLNTTQPMPGSWPINPVGVQAYASWDQGLSATVATLRNGRYGGVLAALGRGDCAGCVAAAVGASAWGTGRFAT